MISIVNNRAGFTLSEVMIGIGLSAIFAIIASSTIFLALSSNKKTKAREETLGKMYTAASLIEDNLSQATNLVFAGAGSINNSSNASTTGNGRMRLFNSLDPAPSGSLSTIAYFIKESQKSESTLNFSDYSAVGIFFQRPNINQSGAIYIDVQNVNGNADLKPRQSKLFFDGIVEFQVLNIYGPSNGAIVNGDPISGVDIRIVTRTFSGSDANVQSWRWCPESQIAANPNCRVPAYIDHERTFHINLRNNDLGIPSVGGAAIRTRSLGPIHFFDSNF